MKAYKHQEQISNQALEILRNQGLVYLSMEERTGKTLTAILTCEKTKAQNILIITKKKALKGWEDTLEAFSHSKSYDAINYESLHKMPFKEYDLVILDEAHANLSAYPKLGKIALQVRSVTYKLPIIYLSATPSAQTYAQLFHQFSMTQYSPFRS
jgi:superfamily II DNA or RNA helicase